MKEAIFHVEEMDCPAEEQLIRMKLQGIDHIEALHFDLPRRILRVVHAGETGVIDAALAELKLGSRLVETRDTDQRSVDQDVRERRVLWAVLGINLLFFAIESSFGILSGSMALLADSLDMLADAIVYGLSLMAVGAAFKRKKSLASVSGYFQIALALIGLTEVLRRFFGSEVPPEFRVMIIVSLLALAANALCLYLLRRAGSEEVHMRASMIFTSNDVIINLGVILAGILVYWLNSGLPDLVIGGIVFIIVVRGAIRILKL